MPTDVPDTLNALPRSSSSSSAPAASTSRPLDDDDDEDVHILEDIEAQEAQEGAQAATKTTTTRRKRRQPDQDDEWMVKVMDHLQRNQTMMERLMLERPAPQSAREADIRYISDLLRTLGEKLGVTDYQLMINQVRGTLDNFRAKAAEAPPPPQPSTSTATPQQTPNFLYPSPNWYGMLGLDHPSQPQPQSQQYQQSQLSQQCQTLTTPPHRPPRASSESLSRVLSSAMDMDGDYSQG